MAHLRYGRALFARHGRGEWIDEGHPLATAVEVSVFPSLPSSSSSPSCFRLRQYSRCRRCFRCHRHRCCRPAGTRVRSANMGFARAVAAAAVVEGRGGKRGCRRCLGGNGSGGGGSGCCRARVAHAPPHVPTEYRYVSSTGWRFSFGSYQASDG